MLQAETFTNCSQVGHDLDAFFLYLILVRNEEEHNLPQHLSYSLSQNTKHTHQNSPVPGPGCFGFLPIFYT